MAARAGDVRTYHNNTYIQTEFAHTITIYVGLAQARPNKVERDVPSADVGFNFVTFGLPYERLKAKTCDCLQLRSYLLFFYRC